MISSEKNANQHAESSVADGSGAFSASKPKQRLSRALLFLFILGFPILLLIWTLYFCHSLAKTRETAGFACVQQTLTVNGKQVHVQFWKLPPDITCYDFNADQIPDLRHDPQNKAFPYAICLDSRWVPCERAAIGQNPTVLPDGQIVRYDFESGKWISAIKSERPIVPAPSILKKPVEAQPEITPEDEPDSSLIAG